MAIGIAWADGAWVDAGWVTGAWNQTLAAPVFSGTIPDISVVENTSTHSYDLSTYFTGATSYSISPSVESGWSFNTSTAELIIDTDDVNTFGPFTVTGTNASGSDSSNAFGVEVTAAAVGGARGSSGRYYTWSPEEIPKGDFVRKYEKTKEDAELERLLAAAIKREDLAKQAKKIADKLGDNVNAVSDLRRAARHVGDEVENLQQKHHIEQKTAQKRLQKLKEEEDLILSIILMEL